MGRKFHIEVLDLSKQEGSLSWDAMLSMNKVKLDVTSDDVMYLLSEKLMSGNNSYIFKTYSKANNKYLIFYDPK